MVVRCSAGLVIRFSQPLLYLIAAQQQPFEAAGLVFSTDYGTSSLIRPVTNNLPR
jgi:hypothetical protein